MKARAENRADSTSTPSLIVTRRRRVLWQLLLGLILAALCAAAAWELHRYWPLELHTSFTDPVPIVTVQKQRMILQSPTGLLLGRVGIFSDELSTYLNFEYIRSLPQVDSTRVLLTVIEKEKGPEYRIYLVLDDDLLPAIQYLSELKAHRYIGSFELMFPIQQQLAEAQQQTELFVAAYAQPVQKKLEEMPPSQLTANVARFIMFKAKTDRRSREGIEAIPSQEQTRELAADILAVSRFYAIPIEFFLGIGAMENNFLNVRGDLEHKVWKRRPEPGDIVLKRRRHRVLVLDYSIGVWQITRETLRYAHNLYLNDRRDYSQLPERLRPPPELDFKRIDPHVLTTYAGLLLRDLLDRFNGDVSKAVGAYNGGPNSPNPDYAAGVATVADYARRVLEQAALVNGRAIAHTKLVVRRRAR